MLALLIVGVLGYSTFMGVRISKHYASLTGSVKEIKLEAAIGHLWLEEVISGDRNEDVYDSFKHIDLSIWHARAVYAVCNILTQNKKFSNQKNVYPTKFTANQ